MAGAAMEALRYPYRPKTWVMLLAGLFFSGCAAILWDSARHNDRGMIINGIIRLDIGQATIFLWVLFACSALFVLLALVALIPSFGTPRELVIDGDGVIIPAGLFAKGATIPFASITDLRIQKVQSQKFLTILHRNGKASVSQSMLPSSAAFEEFVNAVVERYDSRH